MAVVFAMKTGGSSAPSCALTTAALGAVVTGVTHGKDVAEIVGPVLAGVVVPAACKHVVDRLIESPDEPVHLNLNLPGGGQVTQTVSGSELQAPPSPAPSCANWVTPTLRQLCEQGALRPISASP